MLKTMTMATIVGLASIGVAQAAEKESGTSKLSWSECMTVWQKASPGGENITEAQARPYLAEPDKADTNRDNAIDKTEWMTACEKGMVRTAAGEHPPTREIGKVVPEMEKSAPSELPPTKEIGKEVPPMTSPK